MSTAPTPPLAAPRYVDESVNIKRYLAILYKRKLAFIQVFVLILTLGVFGTLASVPVYQTSAKLLVSVPSSTLTLQDSTNPLSQIFTVIQPDNVATQLQVLQSAPFLADAREAAGISREGSGGPSVKVQAVRETGSVTNVIQITVTGRRPTEIANLANKIVELHLEKTSELQTKNIIQAIQFLENERRTAERELAQANAGLLAFRERTRVEQSMAERQARSKQYAEEQVALHRAASNVASAKAQLERLKTELAKEKPDLAQDRRIANPQVAALKERLRELQKQRLELVQEFQDASDPVRSVDEQIRAYEAQLRAEPETITEKSYAANPRYQMYSELVTRAEADLLRHTEDYNAAVAAFNSSRGVLADSGTLELQLNTLTQERERAQARYNSLIDRLQDLAIRKNAKLDTARLIEGAAVPRSPIAPRKTLNIAVTFVLALLLATGVAFGLEYLDDRIDEPDDIRSISSAPALGFVPALPPDDARLILAGSGNSAAAEAYRTLRSSIGFAAIDAPLRSLLVTSATKGDGKSLTCVNLATAMALDGKKVIVVDGDLRRPSIHRLLHIPAAPGLSDVLAGTSSLDETLQPTAMPSMHALSAGTIPPNPAELLGSLAFRQLLDQLLERADVVLFDSPPCLPVTDPVVLASSVDGVILVVGAASTRKFDVHHTITLLENARARVVGFVLNRIEVGKRGPYYYTYYYRQYGDYTPTAERGETARRNGRRSKTRSAEPPALTGASRPDDPKDSA